MSEPYELLISTDARELWERIDAAVARFTELAMSVEETTRLPDSTWCARDVVGHLLTVLRRYSHRVFAQPNGLAATPRGVDQLNADDLAGLGDAGRDELRSELDTELQVVRQMFGPDTIDLRATAPFHGGAVVDMAAALSNIIGEFLIHGRDIAVGVGRHWPIADRDALLILNGVLQIVPAYVKRDAAAGLAVRINLPGARPWLLNIAAGDGASRPWHTGDRVDAVLRAPASTMLLAMYARIGTPAAVRHGLRIVGGRRPWRAARLSALLERP